MNKEYLKKILALCTEEQLELYGRMYPNGPKNIEIAISQVERTLEKSNQDWQDLRAQNKSLEAKIKELEKTIIEKDAAYAELNYMRDLD